MQRIYRVVAQVARTTTTVLITGESGTGKELIARAIHRQGPRRDQPFVAVNPAAIAETLMESELFGHEKGAFTGALPAQARQVRAGPGRHAVPGRDRDAPSPSCRPSCCACCRSARSSGSAAPATIKMDVRIIAATNADVPAAVSRGTFREDLYYRLNVVHIAVPPLREPAPRTSRLLVEHFVRRYNQGVRQADRGPGARRRWRRCAHTAGPATCASCRTSSSARWCWSTARRSASTTCRWSSPLGAAAPRVAEESCR